MTDSLDPARTALLVMDHQPGILGRLPDPAGQIAAAGAALEVARRHGATVGYVRVGLTDDDVDRVPSHSRFAGTPETRAAMHADAPGTQVHEDLAPRDGDVVVRKSRVGAFSTTDLHEQLAARGVDTIVLAGISTSGVVLSTVRDAADRDYRVLVLSDASTDPDPEVHAFLLEKVLSRQARVLTTPELDAALGA